MNDDHKPNGGDDSDDNVVLRITGKHRNCSCYFNMGYTNKNIKENALFFYSICVLLFFIITYFNLMVGLLAVKFARN